MGSENPTLYVTEHLRLELGAERCTLLVYPPGDRAVHRVPVRWGRIYWGRANMWSWLLDANMEGLVTQAAAEYETKVQNQKLRA